MWDAGETGMQAASMFLSLMGVSGLSGEKLRRELGAVSARMGILLFCCFACQIFRAVGTSESDNKLGGASQSTQMTT